MSLKDQLLPFTIKADTSPLVLVRGTAKTLTCLAEISCDCAQSQGLTELSMEGHDLESKKKDHMTKTISEKFFMLGRFFSSIRLNTVILLSVLTFWRTAAMRQTRSGTTSKIVLW